MFKVPERYRIRTGRGGTTEADGNNGCFLLPKVHVHPIFVIASDGGGWEHVSVSIRGAQRCPRWEEMCRVKDLFWDPDDAVVQFHPPRAAYVNHHPHCLHLWRPITSSLPMPPAWMVGPREGQSVAEAQMEAAAALGEMGTT